MRDRQQKADERHRDNIARPYCHRTLLLKSGDPDRPKKASTRRSIAFPLMLTAWRPSFRRDYHAKGAIVNLRCLKLPCGSRADSSRRCGPASLRAGGLAPKIFAQKVAEICHALGTDAGAIGHPEGESWTYTKGASSVR